MSPHLKSVTIYFIHTVPAIRGVNCHDLYEGKAESERESRAQV